MLTLVLDGTKTATASAQWDYEHEGEPIPRVGDLSILLDGAEHPRALIEVTHVDVRPFDEVDAEHAHLEGEGDRSLEHWRTVHERFFADHASHDRGFSPSMPVVLERFRVLYPR
ncbi:ASCH domain-containing protein [Aeromicrobium sp. UC242_57]|uniref:ASCH domain-containing protein n=1 Tax=Aeromicrobium sp. UC242_57 TaxID=3374624 RepID=UPI00379AAB7E